MAELAANKHDRNRRGYVIAPVVFFPGFGDNIYPR
jgi:hypothetical protein